MKFDVMSDMAKEFINDEEIVDTVFEAREKAKDSGEVRRIIAKAGEFGGLTHREAAVLSYVEDPALPEEMYAVAAGIKSHIYGDRIVMSPPSTFPITASQRVPLLRLPCVLWNGA
jgi:2-iminoacetate synthase